MGAYKHSLYTKSRLTELTNTVIECLIGCTVIFFAAFLNDQAPNYLYYYNVFFIYLFCQTVLIFSGRLFLLTMVKAQLARGLFTIKTLFIGNSHKASEIYKTFRKKRQVSNVNSVGFVTADSFGSNGLSKYLPKLGSLSDVEHIIDEQHIEQVIVALDKSELKIQQNLLARLSEKDIHDKNCA